jgi:hypothetical protein
MKNTHKMLVRKCEVKRLFRRSMYRWEDDIRRDLQETGWDDVDWIHLGQDRDQWWAPVNMVNFWIP